ncbi:MAG: diguanylate cyclase [Sedimentibacter sp.]
MGENKKRYNLAKIMLRRFIPAITLIVLLVIIQHIALQNSFERMNIILQKYEISAINQLLIIEKIETWLFFLILFMIAFLTLSIFLPTFKGLSKAFYEVKKSNENIMKLFKIVHGAMFLIELETYNIMLMNKEAERLINTEFKEGINIKNYFEPESHDFCDVFETLVENKYNENMEIELILNENEKMYAIVNSVRLHFNNRDAALIGLFDISRQKQSEETFKNMAIKDKLTGLNNRHYFEERANDKIAESEKYGEPISMLMLDLDYFKNINDTYGHLVGDEVLKLTANTLKNVIRKSDYLFRVGGEEFVVLMPNTDIYAADIVAEKIRLTLESMAHPIAGKITASIGVAEKLEIEILKDWYKRVDKALYCAKEGGRNCVVNYEENHFKGTPEINLKLI